MSYVNRQYDIHHFCVYLGTRYHVNCSPSDMNLLADSGKKETRIIILISAFLTLLVFGLDIITPLGYTITLGYLVILILLLKTRDTKYVLIFTISATLLTLIGFFLSPPGETSI